MKLLHQTNTFVREYWKYLPNFCSWLLQKITIVFKTCMSDFKNAMPKLQIYWKMGQKRTFLYETFHFSTNLRVLDDVQKVLSDVFQTTKFKFGHRKSIKITGVMLDCLFLWKLSRKWGFFMKNPTFATNSSV